MPKEKNKTISLFKIQNCHINSLATTILLNFNLQLQHVEITNSWPRMCSKDFRKYWKIQRFQMSSFVWTQIKLPNHVAFANYCNVLAHFCKICWNIRKNRIPRFIKISPPINGCNKFKKRQGAGEISYRLLIHVTWLAAERGELAVKHIFSAFFQGFHFATSRKCLSCWVQKPRA